MTVTDMRESAAHKAHKRQILEKQAEARGEFWMAQGAYFTDHATIQIMKGRISDEDNKNFTEQNPTANLFLNPTVLLGNRLRVRQQACQLADVDNLFIYVIGDDRSEAKVNMADLPLAGGGTVADLDAEAS